MEGFVELDGSGDDDGGVPIFGGETAGGAFFFWCKVAVVFKDDIFAEWGEDILEDGGVLLDDGGKRDDVDDA